MKTTIDVPDAELREAMEHLGTTTKKDAVVAALREFNRRRRSAALLELSGTCEFDTNDEIEAAESKEARAGRVTADGRRSRVVPARGARTLERSAGRSGVRRNPPNGRYAAEP